MDFWRVPSVSLVGGIAVALVLKYLFGSSEEALVPVSFSIAEGIAPLTIPLATTNEAFGTKGFTVTAMIMMFIGIPCAGIAAGSSWLPPTGALIGQLLPPGSAGSLIRSVAYFEGVGATTALLAL